jgi:hypothetical protein
MTAGLIRRVLLIAAILAMPMAALAQEAVLIGTVSDSTQVIDLTCKRFKSFQPRRAAPFQPDPKNPVQFAPPRLRHSRYHAN